jgi:glycosyltransferase involved in cell wall biosynthesis
LFLTSARGWRGSGISFAKIAIGLAERGHQTLVVTRAAEVTQGFARQGVPVSELQIRNTGFREVAGLRRLLSSQKAHAIMADSPRDLRLAVLAGLWPRRPVVYRYNLNYRTPRNHLGDRLYARGVAGTVFLSEFIEQEVRSANLLVGSGATFRIPNGFDTRYFAPDSAAGAAFRVSYGILPSETVVLTAGKLVRGKRLDLALEALGRIRAAGKPVTYLLCGNGPEESMVRYTGARLGLKVVITGSIEQQLLRGAYNAADLVLHTARETFGNVIGEAMACGRAVACVRDGAAPEVVGDDGKAGVVAPSEDIEALASAVADILNDPVRRAMIGAAARRRIEQVFPLERMISGYEEMFAAMARPPA